MMTLQPQIYFSKDKKREIRVAAGAGFCFGVKLAVDTAYEAISNKNKDEVICMLGEIIHNESVVSDLLSKGLLLAHSTEDVPERSTVIIRAHGISPQIRDRLKEKNCRILDCTCRHVQNIHRIVNEAARADKEIIIAGKKGHPEVEGICGECSGTFHIVSSAKEADNLDYGGKKSILVSQTTFSKKEFVAICEIIKNKIANLEIFDTICNMTAEKQREAAMLATDVDCMIVIGSRHSSNTMELFDECRRQCVNAYLVGDALEARQLVFSLGGERLSGSLGITAGASTPNSIIREVIQVMSENETLPNQEQMDISFGDYIDNIPQLRKNVTVKGTVTSADNEFVYVDVRDKSEGRIPLHEFANDPDFDLDEAIATHREIEVYVRAVRNSDMGKEIILSKAHVDFGKYKAQIEEAYENKNPVTVKVSNVVKDGVIATYGGVDIYIHRTQLEMSTVDDLEAYRGKEIEILITQYDPDKRRLRVSGSRRTLLNQERKVRADEVWSTIEVGAEYDGIVRSLTDFGAFVDIGGVDGLVHVSELSWNRIRHPSEVVKVGDIVHVFVKDFDPDKRRISLGYKVAEDDPYHDIEGRFPAGSIVHGKVVRMFQFGAFVEIADGVDALCHVSQISNTRLNKPEDVLKEGMEVDARVLDVNNETRRISISIREVEPIEPPYANEEKEDTKEDKEDNMSPESFVANDVSAFNSASSVVVAPADNDNDIPSKPTQEVVSSPSEEVIPSAQEVAEDMMAAMDDVAESIEEAKASAPEEEETVSEKALEELNAAQDIIPVVEESLEEVKEDISEE